MIALWGQANPQRKKIGNIGIDIETDLREIEKQNPSRRISECLEATTSKQQRGTSARNDESKQDQFLLKDINHLKLENKNLNAKFEKTDCHIEKLSTPNRSLVLNILVCESK
jgi:hypothetical protein